MAKNTKLPLVAICGRPNVGKSTLFNRMIGKSRAIVHDVEGITRDRYISEAEWRGRRFRVADMGGIIEKPEDSIGKAMQTQVQAALKEASVVVFVVDGQQEITRVDQEVRDELFKYGKQIVLAVNKLDNPQLETRRFDFYELGIGEPYPISSGHGHGMEELKNAVIAALPPAPDVEEEEETREDDAIRLAIIGKPNVGKSSFVNALLNEPRVIVDERPGTTRDAIDVPFVWQEQQYVLIDTAGLRKKAGIRAPVEHFSVSRTLRTIRRADVCLILIDATEGMTEQDKRIIGYTQDNGTPMVIVWTKWDLIEEKEGYFKRLDDDIDLKMPQIDYVPYVTISNVTRQRIFKVFDYVTEVAAEAQKRVPTPGLNKLVEEIKAKHNPPSVKGKHAKILYATQAGVRPTTFIFFVNQKRLFHFSYIRFIENQLRERYGFQGVPLRIELREEKRNEKEGRKAPRR